MSKKISSSFQGIKYKLNISLHPVLIRTYIHILKMEKKKKSAIAPTHLHTYNWFQVFEKGNLKKKCKQDHRTTIYKKVRQWPKVWTPMGPLQQPEIKPNRRPSGSRCGFYYCQASNLLHTGLSILYKVKAHVLSDNHSPTWLPHPPQRVQSK